MKLFILAIIWAATFNAVADTLESVEPSKLDYWRFQAYMGNGRIFIKDVQDNNNEINFWLKAEYELPFDCKRLNGEISEPTVRDKRACQVAREKQTAKLVVNYVLSCSRAETKRMRANSYNYANELLTSTDIPTEWSPIYPQTAAALVSKELCEHR